jgi:hypothetical protein
MDRRRFLRALGLAAAAAAAPRRVYSFLWDNPLVRSPTLAELQLLAAKERFLAVLTAEAPLLEQAFADPLFPGLLRLARPLWFPIRMPIRGALLAEGNSWVG